MNDELTTRLSRELHDRADGLHGAPLTLESVRGRARSIQRTRRLTAAGIAAVAVAAVTVPTGLIGDVTGRTDRELPPVTNTPSESAEPTEAEEPRTDKPVLGVPYLAEDVVVRPDGTERELPESYQGGAVLGETVFALRPDGSGFLVLDELDADGRVVDSDVVESGIARNTEGSAIAYVTGGELVVRWEDGRTTLGDAADGTPVRLVGGPDCSGAAACSVYVNDGIGGSRLVDGTGADEDVTDEPITLTDVAADLRMTVVAPGADPAEPGSCSTLVGPKGGAIHDSCDYTYGDFSPAGTHLAATHPYQDGFGDGWRAILDAGSGEELARYESPSGGITRSVWEDEQHLLITSWEDGEWKVTRLGVDGTTEVVLGPTKGPQESPSYSVLGSAF